MTGALAEGNEIDRRARGGHEVGPSLQQLIEGQR